MEAKLGAGLLAIPIATVVYWAFNPLDFPVRGIHYFLLTWALAAGIAGFVAIKSQRSALQLVGLALILVPVARTLLSILNSLGPLFGGGAPPPAFTEYQLSTFYSRKLLIQVGYPAAGFLLFVNWRPNWSFSKIAAAVRQAGIPTGKSEGHSALAGWLFFPVLLLGAFLTQLLLTQNVPNIVNTAPGGPYANMTVFHSIVLSLAASIGEEVVYRCVIMVGAFALASKWIPTPRAWLVAWLVQGIIFGFAHASFNNPLLVLQATLFGLLSGFAALRFGILSAIVLHFLIDLYAFGSEVGGTWAVVLGALLLVNTVASALGGAQWIARTAAARRQ